MLFDSDEASLSETNIRRSYDAALERLARLLAFCNYLPTGIGGDIESRQVALAIDDLTIFAINARRLVSEAKCGHLAMSVEVPRIKVAGTTDNWMFVKTGESVAVSRILNAILHHVWIEVYYNSYQVRRLLIGRPVSSERDVESLLAYSLEYYLPKIVLQSDWPKKDPPIYFLS